MHGEYRDRVEPVANQGWDERVIVVRCGTLVNVFIVVADRYVVLVDTLLNPRTGQALLEIAREHIGARRQLLVVNTHADWDHAWGNQVFAGPDALQPAPIIATHACAERLRSTGEAQKLVEMRAAQPERFASVRLVPPTICFDERLTIDGGDLTIELFPTPGHTHDHLGIFIPEIGLLLAGDAAEEPFPFIGPGDGIIMLRRSLARMVDLAPAHVLYCHAPVTSGPDLLYRNIAYFDELERSCRAALARGVSSQPAEDSDVEALAAYPFADAIQPGLELAPDWAEDYRDAHRDAIRAMLQYCADHARL